MPPMVIPRILNLRYKEVFMLTKTKKLLSELIGSGELSNFAICIGRGDEILTELYSDNVNENTLFDMASVTKVMSVTMISLISLEKGLLNLNDKVSRFFDVPKHYEELSIENLLTHTMGIGHKNLINAGRSYEDIAEYILTLYDESVGSDVFYSCPAFILLGKILEKIYNKRLDILFDELVAKPLNMRKSSFLPTEKGYCDIVNSNRAKEERGLVNDYNCRYLGGIAGNAGIFSNISDMKLFVNAMLNNGYPLFSKKTLDNATMNHTNGMSEARGLGFLYVDERYKQTGELFPVGSVGHCGHTGTSVFFNRDSGLYVIILSDATISVRNKYDKSDYYDKVMLMRENLHNTIKKDLNL